MKLLVGTLLLVSVLPSFGSVSPSPFQGRSTQDECVSMSFRLRAFRLVTNCNFTTLKEKQVKEIQAPTTNLYLPIMYLVAFCVGLPTNLLALWVLVFRTKNLPSTTLLINLTVVDCLLLLVLPFRIVYHFRGNHWDLGEPLCRTVMAMFYGNMYGSVWCLALVALDRYIALVHPFDAKILRSQRLSLYMSGVVWVVILAAMLPLLLSQQTYPLDDPKITTCHDALPENEQENFFLPYFGTLFVCGFLLPFIIVLYCHSAVLRTLLAKGKRYSYAIRITALVMVVFILCLLPSNLLLLLTYSDTSLAEDDDDLYVPYMISLAVSTFNSCIDPFIFYFVSPEFRQKAKSTLCSLSEEEVTASSQWNHGTSSAEQRSEVTLVSMTCRKETSDAAVRCKQEAIVV
ncbi:PREDICTED: proteinase-activated receptor 4 [Cyprinodon variegatus]|uniref:F2R like thrombin or trypsin receptor 3 n=1 Tax=Cyprinodon variegatus TaxID=28743 RepID=A0A3Q2CFF3_CYPVA|nr:PREDICTED: proteinase-activated receptor 4 [Cyprinodon variegatus]